ncbi:aspartyl protease, partial [Rhizoctonia solani 123E]
MCYTGWTANIGIGKEPQYFDLHVGTGSSSTWVISSKCVAAGCSSTRKYDASKSSTSKQTRSKESTLYLDGSFIKGKIMKDTLTVGGLSAAYQSFVSVRSTVTLKLIKDGFLGLSAKPESLDASKNIVNTLFQANQISNRIFSLHLSSGPGAELYIGGINSKKYTGTITYLPSKPRDYWIVQGTANANGKIGYTGDMMIDSGVSHIRGPEKSVGAWWDLVKGARPCIKKLCPEEGFYMFPCEGQATYSFTFNGRTFPLTKDDLTLIRVNPRVCVGTIHVDKHLKDTWILGAKFMRTVYTVFDMEKNQVGFATPNHATNSA